MHTFFHTRSTFLHHFHFIWQLFFDFHSAPTPSTREHFVNTKQSLLAEGHLCIFWGTSDTKQAQHLFKMHVLALSVDFAECWAPIEMETLLPLVGLEDVWWCKMYKGTWLRKKKKTQSAPLTDWRESTPAFCFSMPLPPNLPSSFLHLFQKNWHHPLSRLATNPLEFHFRSWLENSKKERDKKNKKNPTHFSLHLVPLTSFKGAVNGCLHLSVA